ncbi:hypothetical protein TGFOU_225480 [Toxoplasma gondii FOU]|uniref:Uncharacterized protein n=3 Tax=Toxoplasma gondii TaxID=5811 RepID=A0A086LES3_TOXGO|nr:hypothetical protein TGFOU_225480 [Toxoplasma gondii FOU]PUA91216.1 hypothetical protein TGBR9_225480 [Toxoplasma gondii TgCATBr9]RQX74566.1 hypothetical protein TGCAST_225480 [Toxoplasma gondii CAST]
MRHCSCEDLNILSYTRPEVFSQMTGNTTVPWVRTPRHLELKAPARTANSEKTCRDSKSGQAISGRGFISPKVFSPHFRAVFSRPVSELFRSGCEADQTRAACRRKMRGGRNLGSTSASSQIERTVAPLHAVSTPPSLTFESPPCSQCQQSTTPSGVSVVVLAPSTACKPAVSSKAVRTTTSLSVSCSTCQIFSASSRSPLSPTGHPSASVQRQSSSTPAWLSCRPSRWLDSAGTANDSSQCEKTSHREQAVTSVRGGSSSDTLSHSVPSSTTPASIGVPAPPQCVRPRENLDFRTLLSLSEATEEPCLSPSMRFPQADAPLFCVTVAHGMARLTPPCHEVEERGEQLTSDASGGRDGLASPNECTSSESVQVSPAGSEASRKWCMPGGEASAERRPATDPVADSDENQQPSSLSSSGSIRFRYNSEGTYDSKEMDNTTASEPNGHRPSLDGGGDEHPSGDDPRGSTVRAFQDPLDDDDASEYGVTDGSSRLPGEPGDGCCSTIWTMSTEELFGFDFIANCTPERFSRRDRRTYPSQEDAGDAVKQVLRAEASAREIVNRARSLQVILRQRVRVEAEEEEKRFRNLQQSLFEARSSQIREELEAFAAEETMRTEAFVEHSKRPGFEHRITRAKEQLLGEVLKVDVSCPLEAVKRFGTTQQLVAFYEKRQKKTHHVVHHPPGDILERDKDIITWDEQGRARVEHLSASTHRRSVTKLGSFWVRHQNRGAQHSDRPLVFLNTHSWGDAHDVANNGEAQCLRLRSVSEDPEEVRAVSTDRREQLNSKHDIWCEDIPDEDDLDERGPPDRVSQRTVHSLDVLASKGWNRGTGGELANRGRD